MWLVLAGVAWLPGATILGGVVESADDGADESPLDAIVRGPGTPAFAFAISVATIAPCILPFFLAETAFSAARTFYAAVLALIGLIALVRSLRESEPPAHARPSPTAWDWGAFACAVAVLLPVVSMHAGATVDDWWDLSFVRSYLESPRLTFAEPLLGSAQPHPRFLWNSWYIVQSLVLEGRVGEAVAMQSGPLAAFVCVMVVSASALLARTVFADQPAIVRRFAVLAVPLWLYGTEALPFFTRLHQDKFVAGLVLVPVLLSAVLFGLRVGMRPLVGVLILLASVAVCSTHSLVYGVGMIGVGTLVLAELFSGAIGVGRALAVVSTAAPPLLYPIGQAMVLSARFDAQHISLAYSDNPVVIAHLSLERLVRPLSEWYIVHPGAVFGPIAAIAVVGFIVCWMRRREHAFRVVFVLTLMPCALIFLPGVASAVGSVMVPWMVYRVGWLVPVPLLLAAAFDTMTNARFTLASAARLAVVFLLALVAVVPVAADRLRRDMREHPASREGGPRGTTKHLYDFLATLPRGSRVVGETGISRLIPAFTGHSTLAMAERSTLVFSKDEASAYKRLRARSDFYAADAGPERRGRLAGEYGLTHAVFRRSWITAGSEARWLRGSAGAGFALLSTTPDRRTPHFDADVLLAALPEGSQFVFANDDFFVAALARSEQDMEARSADGPSSGEGAAFWADVFDVTSPAKRREGLAVVGSAVRYPGARVAVAPVPVALGSTSFPVWTGGGELWEDAATEVRVVLNLAARCDLEILEIVPYLPTGRREVFEVVVDDVHHRLVARHKKPLVVPLSAGRRSTVFMRVRSMVGVSFGLSDVRVRADPQSCDDGWDSLAEPQWPQAQRSLGSAMQLVREYPLRGASTVALAEMLDDVGRSGDARAVLRYAVSMLDAEPVPWIEYGLIQDSQGEFVGALVAYETAVESDSNSAWARGCLAWAELRRKAYPQAIWHAWQALRLDDDYSDAYTILANAAKRLGARGYARVFLDRAIAMDRYRSWGYLERARMLDEDGMRKDAVELLEGFMRLVPSDPDATALLASYLSEGLERSD